MSTPQEVPAVFKIHSRENKKKSLAAGHPIFDDVEVVEMRIPGDRERVIIQPALHIWKYVQGQPITYAMRFSEQYRRFKEGHTQLQSGTPLNMLTEMPQRKILEYAALNVHTIQGLANLEGQQLKTLGMGALEWKKKAQEYLENATGANASLRLSQENEELKARLSALEARFSSAPELTQAQGDHDVVPSGPFAGKTAADLKEWIEQKTGARPRGNPSLQTLASSAESLMQEHAA